MTNIYNLTEKEKQKLAVLVAQAQRDELKQEEMLRIVALHPRAEGFIKMHRRLTPERVQTEIQGFLKLMAAVLPTSPLPSMRMEPNTEKLPLKGDGGSFNTQHPTPNTPNDRPRHYDTWFDQMSPELQKKVATLKDLHTKKIYYRNQVEALAADPNHSTLELSRCSTALSAYVDKIQAIYDRADVEWDELQGRTVSDETKQQIAKAELKADKEIVKTSPNTQPTTPNTEKLPLKGDEESSNTQNPTPNTQDDSYLATLTYQQITEHTGLTDVQKKYWYDRRVENARKYLRDKLTAPYSDKKIEKAKGYIEELKLAGKKLSPRAIENIQSAGIEFPADMSE